MVIVHRVLTTTMSQINVYHFRFRATVRVRLDYFFTPPHSTIDLKSMYARSCLSYLQEESRKESEPSGLGGYFPPYFPGGPVSIYTSIISENPYQVLQVTRAVSECAMKSKVHMIKSLSP